MDKGSGLLIVSLVTFLTLLANGAMAVYVCEKPSDVVFVLDISNSIWRPDFDRQKNFVRAVINRFTVGDENMRVGAVAFADFPRLQFHLNRFSTKRDVKQAIGRMRQHGGIYTFTADAIRYMRKRSFQYENGMRQNTTKIGIVITDGRSYDTVVTGIEAAKAREEGIHIFAIGVGNKVDQHELDVIASHPVSDYSFMVENFNSLKHIQDLLAEKACTVTDPPTTTTTTTTTTPMPTTTTTTTTTTTPPATFPQIRFVTPSPDLPVYSLPGSEDDNENPQEFKGHNPDMFLFPDINGQIPDDSGATAGKKSKEDDHPNQIGGSNLIDNELDNFGRPSHGLNTGNSDSDGNGLGSENIRGGNGRNGGDGNSDGGRGGNGGDGSRGGNGGDSNRDGGRGNGVGGGRGGNGGDDSRGGNGVDGGRGGNGGDGSRGSNGGDGSSGGSRGGNGGDGSRGSNGGDGNSDGGRGNGVDGSRGGNGGDGNSDGSRGGNGVDGSRGGNGVDGSRGGNGVDGSRGGNGVDGSRGGNGVGGSRGGNGVDGSRGGNGVGGDGKTGGSGRGFGHDNGQHGHRNGGHTGDNDDGSSRTGGDNDSKRDRKSKKNRNKTSDRNTFSHYSGKTLEYHSVLYAGEGCGPQQPTDIVFVVDSKSGSDAYQRYLWNFVRDVISRLDMKDDLFRIQFVHECVAVPEMALDSYTDKSSLMSELKTVIDAPRRTASLLRSMSGKITSIQNPFEERRKVGVYITDGQAMDSEETAIAAREAKDKFGVDMHVVGVGGRINPTELRSMVSKVDTKHLYMMSHHMKLPKVARHLAKQMCIKHKSRRLKLKHNRR